MNCSNLFIITFLLFVTDLNHTANVRCAGPITPHAGHLTSTSPRPRSGTGAHSLKVYQPTAALANTDLKVVSIFTKEEPNGTKIVTKEHLSNESLVTKEISKNLLLQKQQSTRQPKQQSVASVTTQVTTQAPIAESWTPELPIVKMVTQHRAQRLPTIVHTTATPSAKKLDECSKSKLDYLVLSLTWPVNICSRRSCILNSPQRWFIHNLGYFNLQGSLPPHCCGKRPFNYSELGSTLTNELKEHMQSVLATKPDESFWFEEWQNVGTCLNSNEKLNTLHKYFSQTLRLFKTINLERWLKEKDIVPLDDINKAYDFQTFYQAIFAKRSFKFQVICNPLAGNETTVSVVDYVNFCFDNELNSAACPSVPQLESNCHKKLIFPSLDAIESVIQDKRKRFSAFLSSGDLSTRSSHDASGFDNSRTNTSSDMSPYLSYNLSPVVARTANSSSSPPSEVNSPNESTPKEAN